MIIVVLLSTLVPTSLPGSIYHSDLEQPVRYFPEAGLLKHADANKYCNQEVGGITFKWYYNGDYSIYRRSEEERNYWKGNSHYKGTKTCLDKGLIFFLAFYKLFKAHGTIKALMRQAPVLQEAWMIWNRQPTYKPAMSLNWRRSYYSASSCTSVAGYMCRRKAAGGMASEANGEKRILTGYTSSLQLDS